MRFSIDPGVLERFPGLSIGIVLATGVYNSRGREQASEVLRGQAERVRSAWSYERLDSDPRIAAWREAYRVFGAKPKKHWCSVENAIRMILSGPGIRSINPVVDLYNAVSLEHCIPVGGDDLDRVEGDIHLTIATGDERFVPLNGTDAVSPKPGEVIYRDDDDVLCRRWNWRECDKSKLTESTTNLCLVVEGLPPFSADDVSQIASELAETVETHCSGRTTVRVLDRHTPGVELSTSQTNDRS